MKTLFTAALTAALALISFPAFSDAGDKKPTAKLSDDSWLWSTGDFHPDRGVPDESIGRKRGPEGERDTA